MAIALEPNLSFKTALLTAPGCGVQAKAEVAPPAPAQPSLLSTIQQALMLQQQLQQTNGEHSSLCQLGQCQLLAAEHLHTMGNALSSQQ